MHAITRSISSQNSRYLSCRSKALTPPIANFALQTLYIFLGVAVLVGILTGTSLHYASSYLIAFLSLEKRPEQQRGRTLASYRRDKQDKRKDTSPKLDYELGGRAGGNAMSRRISTDSLASSMDVPGKLKISDGNSQRFDAMLKEETMEFEWPKKGRKRANNDLIPNTILEEDSTEDDL